MEDLNLFCNGEANWVQYDASVSNPSPLFMPWSLPSTSSISNSIHHLHDLPSWSFDEDRATSASKSHSQAEKRRRDRINAQLTALRKLIPKSDRMDKAALLGSVIEHVKDLKRKASEVSKSITVPTEVDEVTIDCNVSEDAVPSDFKGNSRNIFIRASLCCNDRPELFGEVIRVIGNLQLRTVKAEICSVGGRIKSILLLCSKDGEKGVCVSTLKQSLKAVLSRIVSLSMEPNCHIRSKRQRFFFPSQH